MELVPFDAIIRELCTTILSEANPAMLPKRIIDHVQKTFHVEWSTLWLTEQQSLSTEKQLRLKAAAGPAEQLLSAGRGGEAAVYLFSEGLTGYIAKQRETVNITCWEDFDKYPHQKKYDLVMYKESGAKDKCKAVLGIPLLLRSAGTEDGADPGWRVIGVLKLENVDPSYRPQRYFTPEDVRIIEAYAAVVAVALEKAQMQDDSLRIGSGLLAVSAKLLAQLGDPPNLDEFVKETAQVISAKACALWLRSGLELRLAAQWGYPYTRKDVEPPPYPLGEAALAAGEKLGLTVYVASNKQVLNLRTMEEVRNHPAWRGANDQRMWGVTEKGTACYSLLAVPLVDDETGQVRGVFKIENKQPTIFQLESYFNAEDQKLLTALGNSINSSLAIAERFARLQKLEQIAGQIRYPEGEEAALFLLLTALTHGGGLGYNRALAFMSNGEEQPKELTCRFAIGHLEMELWNQAMQEPTGQLNLSEKLSNFQADDSRHVNTEIMRRWRNVRVSLTDLATQKLAYQAQEKRESGKYISEDLHERDALHNFSHGDFALIPIHEGPRLRGIIYCDNRFTGDTINRFELQILDVFAGIAGAVLDAAEVPARVRETEETAWRRFSQPAAHRLGTETNIIDGFVKYECLPALDKLKAQVGDGNPNVEEIRNALEVIRGSAGRLGDAKKDYSELSQEPETPLRIDLAAHIQAAIRGARLSALTIRFEPPVHVVTITARPRRLTYVFDELFLNAWKESPAARGRGGKPICVRVEIRETEDRVEVAVVDSGPGIAPEIQDRLFQTPQSGRHGGTGLGLMIIKRRLEAEGGTIRLYPEGRSRDYKGASFLITLPRGAAGAGWGR